MIYENHTKSRITNLSLVLLLCFPPTAFYSIDSHQQVCENVAENTKNTEIDT